MIRISFRVATGCCSVERKMSVIWKSWAETPCQSVSMSRLQGPSCWPLTSEEERNRERRPNRDRWLIKHLHITWISIYWFLNLRCFFFLEKTLKIKNCTKFYSVYLACISLGSSFFLFLEIVSHSTTEYCERSESGTYRINIWKKKVSNAVPSIDDIWVEIKH